VVLATLSFAMGDQFSPPVLSGDGEYLNVFADDSARARKRSPLVEEALEAHQLLVLVIAVDGDVSDQFGEAGVTAPWRHDSIVALGDFPRTVDHWMDPHGLGTTFENRARPARL
jgi:hypothetical protein